MKTFIHEKNLPEAAKIIRHVVFEEEQGFIDEFDETDAIATHLVMFDEDESPIATCRVFWDAEKNTYMLGRLAVMKEYRNKHVGSLIMQEAENHVCKTGGKSIILHAQCQASGFYQKQGYSQFGDVDDEQGCPHMWMKKYLNIE